MALMQHPDNLKRRHYCIVWITGNCFIFLFLVL